MLAWTPCLSVKRFSARPILALDRASWSPLGEAFPGVSVHDACENLRLAIGIRGACRIALGRQPAGLHLLDTRQALHRAVRSTPHHRGFASRVAGLVRRWRIRGPNPD